MLTLRMTMVQHLWLNIWRISTWNHSFKICEMRSTKESLIGKKASTSWDRVGCWCLSKTYPCFPILLVVSKPLAISTVFHNITCDPLMRVVSSLSCNTSQSSHSTKIKLKPLFCVSFFGGPGPYSTITPALVKTTSVWSVIVVVLWWSRQLTRKDPAIF